MQGGVGDYTRELSKSIANLGHQVYILTRRGCHAEGLPANCFVYPEVARWNWSTARQIRRWVRDTGVSVVNLQYQAAAYQMHPAINLLPGRLARAPLAVTFHDLKAPYLFPKAGRLRHVALTALARRASLVIVTNQEDLLLLRTRKAAHRLALIPIGSNIAPAPPARYDRALWRKRWGTLEDETLLGFFGFLHAGKGAEDLLASVQRLNKRGVPVRLVMIGGRTGSSDPTIQAYSDAIDGLVKRLCIEEQVHWTGFVSPEEVSAHFLTLDICVLPYRDGASFRRGSLMAALAHGRPIVTTTPAIDLPELRHRENVYLVPPAAPNALEEAVVTLRENRELCETLAAGACELARSFEWDSIARTTLDVLATLEIRD
jgi:glycosyltransferase involved in cell wall biosynthesis